jgi:hypothetical protein
MVDIWTTRRFHGPGVFLVQLVMEDLGWGNLSFDGIILSVVLVDRRLLSCLLNCVSQYTNTVTTSAFTCTIRSPCRVGIYPETIAWQ